MQTSLMKRQFLYPVFGKARTASNKALTAPAKTSRKPFSKRARKVSGKAEEAKSSAENGFSIQDLLKSFAKSTVIAYTDGACHGNCKTQSSPCGAGAAVFFPRTQEWVERFLALGEGTNNIGELNGVGLALTLIREYEDKQGMDKDCNVEILTDSKYALGVLDRQWNVNANQALVEQIKEQLAARRQTHAVRLSWCKAHAGIPGNERADRLAVQGVLESRRKIQKSNTVPMKQQESSDTTESAMDAPA